MYTDRKSKDVDIVFAAKFVKMYLCTGRSNWVDGIQDTPDKFSEYFVLKQILRLLTENVCDEGSHIYKTNAINPRGFEAWFQNKEKEKRREIRGCISKNFADSLRLLVCCHDASRKMISFITRCLYDLFNCPDLSQKHPILCNILHLFVQTDIEIALFEIINRIKICDGRCPIAELNTNKPTNQQTNKPMRSAKAYFHGIEKRQFDMATILDNVKQFVCGASLFIEDMWKDVFTYEVGDHSDPKHIVDYLRFVSVFRKPTCCVLLDHLQD